MDRPSPARFNEILTGLTLLSEREFNQVCDHIEDPETGLALLSKRPGPGKETPEQALSRSFWQDQFTHYQRSQTGDVTAVYYALFGCALSGRPPPTWLCKAVGKLCEQCMSDHEKRTYGDLKKHIQRWEAVELVRGRLKGHPLNRKSQVLGDAVWAEAAKLVAGTDAEASAETVRKSHALIKAAGGHDVTLQTYRHEVEERDRYRKE